VNYLLTVGKNPLPVALAALHFARENAQSLIFIHSTESKPEAEILEKFLRGKIPAGTAVRIFRVDSEDGREIESSVHELLGQLAGGVHLHYSGGTSAMALHAMRALSTGTGSFDGSYLSMKSNQIKNGAGGRIGPLDLRREIEISFEDLIALHGYAVVQSFNGRAVPPVSNRLEEMAGAWKTFLDGANRMSDEIADLKRKYPRLDSNRHGNDEIRLAWNSGPPPGLPELMNRLLQSEVWRLNSAGGYEAVLRPSDTACRDLQHFFAGNGWFELIVLKALRDALGQAGWPDTTRHAVYCARRENVIQMKETFELDVIVVLGYQLLLVSCTSSKNPKESGSIKLKGFEALHRSRQLGGAGARAIVVSRIDAALAEQDQESLHLDIGLGEGDRSLLVWGQSELEDLTGNFRRYLTKIAESGG
jgi:hypothetical protein